MDDIESQKQESRGTELKSPARTLTIHDDGRTLQRTLHRTHSIRETVPLAARIPTEFRTLSIHVDDHTARRVPSTLSDKYLGKHKGPVTGTLESPPPMDVSFDFICFRNHRSRMAHFFD